MTVQDHMKKHIENCRLKLLISIRALTKEVPEVIKSFLADILPASRT